MMADDNARYFFVEASETQHILQRCAAVAAVAAVAARPHAGRLGAEGGECP